MKKKKKATTLHQNLLKEVIKCYAITLPQGKYPSLFPSTPPHKNKTQRQHTLNLSALEESWREKGSQELEKLLNRN